MSPVVWDVLWVSVRVATLSTLLCIVPASALGFLLATQDFPAKKFVSALTGLPLVLPPTAVGYVLLRLFAVDGPLGQRVLGFDLGILMTFKAAVVAATVMSFPLVVRTARVTFEALDPRLLPVARTLGHAPLAAFFRFSLPLGRRGLLAAAIVGFTRAVGEFGATVTVAGNIPGQTSSLAAAIWSAQEVGARGEAWQLISLAIILGLGASILAESLTRTAASREHSTAARAPSLRFAPPRELQ